MKRRRNSAHRTATSAKRRRNSVDVGAVSSYNARKRKRSESEQCDDYGHGCEWKYVEERAVLDVLDVRIDMESLEASGGIDGIDTNDMNINITDAFLCTPPHGHKRLYSEVVDGAAGKDTPYPHRKARGRNMGMGGICPVARRLSYGDAPIRRGLKRVRSWEEVQHIKDELLARYNMMNISNNDGRLPDREETGARFDFHVARMDDDEWMVDSDRPNNNKLDEEILPD